MEGELAVDGASVDITDRQNPPTGSDSTAPATTRRLACVIHSR
jgi:hypothetical protein